ncbi:hypothetical protein G6F68_017779 [Rhizopus microsporus]|nr:hypothetical protein G6F68_017779 [Rhizopus microsporus]
MADVATPAIERRANGAQIGGAFQCHAGAAQRHDHAQEGAEHAQQHQQADKIGRQRRAGQADPFAFHPQPRRIAQAGMQRVQPGGQTGRRFLQVGDRTRQAGGGLLVAQQFQRAG